MRPLHGFPRRAEHQRGIGLVKPQDVDDGIFSVGRCNTNGAIVDVGMLLVALHRFDANSVALIAARQCFDLARHGGREQECLAAFRGCVENEFQILAESEIEHLVGLVEHNGCEFCQVKPPPF